MISELLVDLFCERRSCFVVRGFGFEKFQYTNATGLIYIFSQDKGKALRWLTMEPYIDDEHNIG